jgi:hypothetical protein
MTQLELIHGPVVAELHSLLFSIDYHIYVCDI